MSRKVVSKERGVFEKEPGSNIWWIRFKANGVEHREKVGRCGDAIKLYPALRICRAQSFPKERVPAQRSPVVARWRQQPGRKHGIQAVSC
jgi:hypothetical protein